VAYLLAIFRLFCCFSSYLYVRMCFFATTCLVNKDLYKMEAKFRTFLTPPVKIRGVTGEVFEWIFHARPKSQITIHFWRVAAEPSRTLEGLLATNLRAKHKSSRLLSGGLNKGQQYNLLPCDILSMSDCRVVSQYGTNSIGNTFFTYFWQYSIPILSSSVSGAL